MQDEIKLVKEDSERERIYELFESAVKDYIGEFTFKWIFVQAHTNKWR